MGTDAWRNWRGFVSGEGELEYFEDELQSDVSFVGGPATFGPYGLSIVIREPGAVGPALILRCAVHAWLAPEIVVDGKLAKSDSSAYHGGTMSDEIGALISLALGVRVRLGGTRRLSGLHGVVRRGPPAEFEVPRLVRPGPPGHELLPRAVERVASVDNLSRLQSFPMIDEVAQVELVRAARSYAAGLWWANEDPNQAWLHFVTAVETAAKSRQLLGSESGDLLKEHWPELWAVIEPSHDDIKAGVAKLLAPQMKATRTFIDFLVEGAPPAPEHRPESSLPLDWARMRKHAGVIYNYRSQALHSGKPFPMPMLRRPRRDESGAIQEVPDGLNSGGLGGVWDAAETPMLLSTFEYIARGALLRWWDELAKRRET